MLLFFFSCSVLSTSLPPHGQHYAGLPCHPQSPGACLNSYPLSVMRSSHLILRHPLSSCLQSFPASGSFQMSQRFSSGGQSTGVSASTSVLPMNTQDWPPLGWTGWIFLQSKGLTRVFSSTTVQSVNSSVLSFLHSPTLTSIHDHWKNHSLELTNTSLAK